MVPFWCYQDSEGKGRTFVARTTMMTSYELTHYYNKDLGDVSVVVQATDAGEYPNYYI